MKWRFYNKKIHIANLVMLLKLSPSKTPKFKTIFFLSLIDSSNSQVLLFKTYIPYGLHIDALLDLISLPIFFIITRVWSPSFPTFAYGWILLMIGPMFYYYILELEKVYLLYLYRVKISKLSIIKYSWKLKVIVSNYPNYYHK